MIISNIMMTATTVSVILLLLLSSNAIVAYGEATGQCIGKEEIPTLNLNFFDSTVTENKLHEGGTLRYDNIGTVNGRVLDFEVSVVSGTTYSTKKSKRNGLGSGGKFGNINVMELKNNDLINGEGNFEFCLRDHTTNELTEIELFHFSLFDVDERNEAANGIKEKVVMDTSQIADYILSKESEIQVFCEDGSTNLPCPEGIQTVFHSSTKGVGSDNPTDPNKLKPQQKNRSIVFTFKNTSCFTMTYYHYCPVNHCRWYGGGNFLFSGDASEIIDKGECHVQPTLPPTVSPTVSPTNRPTANPTMSPTTSPTVAPTTSPTNNPTMSPTNSPTKNPTMSPTNYPTTVPTNPPTDEPTNPPTDAPTTMSPTNAPVLPPIVQRGAESDDDIYFNKNNPHCPDDVQLIRTHGVTPFPTDTTAAVRILSQDTSTVTVQLQQVWESSTAVVDQIYYQYKASFFQKQCFEEVNVGFDTTYAELTIQCNVMTPYAYLQICIVDDLANNTFLSLDDHAKIPKCCHAADDGGNADGDGSGVTKPTVCYSLQISCDTTCSVDDDVARRGLLRGGNSGSKN